MSRYERRENPISIITFCMIVVELMIDMAKLLPESTASEKGEVEKTLNLVRECKKFRNQELCKIASALNKSIQMGEEEGKKAEVAKNLLKAGISVDITLQTTGLSKDELKKHDKTEIVYALFTILYCSTLLSGRTHVTIIPPSMAFFSYILSYHHTLGLYI